MDGCEYTVSRPGGRLKDGPQNVQHMRGFAQLGEVSVSRPSLETLLSKVLQSQQL